MDTGALGFALAAGMVAAVNPCGFAMLPPYLTLVVVGTSGGRGRAAAIYRALVATGAMALGFLTVFGAFGLVITPLASSVQRYLPLATVVIGTAVGALGAWMITGRQVALLLPKPRRGAPSHRLASMTGYGFGYATVSLSCTIGPFLAVTGSTFRAGSIASGVAAYLAYALGMTLVVGVLAVAAALTSATAARGLRKLLPHVSRIGGGLLVLVGFYVAYYGVYELRLFHNPAATADTVVDGVGTVQAAIASWVSGLGPLPPAIALGLLVGFGVLFRRGRPALRRPSAPVTPEPVSGADHSRPSP